MGVRTAILAVVIGIALGAAALVSANIPMQTNVDAPRTGERLSLISFTGRSAVTAGHSDSNTSGESVYLNQNVINGTSTAVCTRDQALQSLTDEAVQAWNNALKTRLGFSPFTLITTADCSGANVEVVQPSIATCTNSFNVATGLGTRACYRPHKTNDPPRAELSNRGMPVRLRDRALIIYQALAYEPGSRRHFATMVHELGHALGLAHYEHVCSQLRTASVDPAMDHFTAMASGRDACRARGVITGRDLRDFYEAYHVAPVTNVGYTSSTSVSTTGIRAKLTWGATGAQEAWHNASRLAVMARTASDWRLVSSVSISKRDPEKKITEDGAYQPITGLTFTDPDQTATLYKIVGVTRGDIQLNPLDDDVDLTVDQTTATYRKGDPSYVDGLTAIDPTPSVFSASLDRRYCFQSAPVGTISARATGGTGTPTIHRPSLRCPQAVGRTSFRTAAWWGTGTTRTDRHVDLPAQVYLTPAGPNFATPLTASPASCVAGETVTVTWALQRTSQSVTVWIDGVKAASSPATFTCPSSGDDVQVLALRSDGGGVALTVDIIEPLTVAFTGKSANGETCTVAQLLQAEFSIAGGESPYKAKLGSGQASPVQTAGSGLKYYRCPNTGTTLRVSVTDAVGRTASATTPLNITPVPTPPVTPPATDPLAPTNVHASTSVTATTATATLTWTAPAGASNVSYKLWRSEATSNSSTTGTSYTFENLNPYQTYNLYVWTVNAAGVESAKVVTQVKMPGRPGVPRTAAPTGLQASNITTSSATLGWNAVPGATGYRVWRSSGQSVRLPATARSYTFAGLLPSRKYSLTVWAIGHGGLSPTARVVIHTQGPTLATPTGLRATTSVTATTATATLTWSAVSGVASYGLWRSDGQNVTTTGTSYTFTGLIPHKRYNLYVWTVDSAGHGSTHARVSVTLPGRPGVAQTAAPTGVQASGITASSATLSWNGVAGATGYEVWRSGGQSVDLASTARSYTFTGLTGERRYSLYVWALGSRGMSPQTRVVITTLPAPAPPAGLRATATSTTLTLRWNAAAGATSYEVQRSGSSTARTVSSGRAYTFTGLTAGTSYTLYVRSKNNNGHSAWVSVSGVTAPPQPSVPSIAATHNSLTLSWSSVRGATGYEVKRVGSSTIWTTTGTSYTFSRLSSNASYTLSVRATNAGGKSAWRSQTGTTLLPNPTGLSVSANTSSSLTLSWTLDSRAIWYRVKRGAGGTEQLLSSSRSSYTFSGLSANTSYTLYVRAVGAGGLTGWSSTSARTATSLAACLTTTRLNTYSTWASLDSHCSNGGSASALWADLQAASVGVGCISHWNTSAGSWQRYQRGSGWSSFTIAYGAVLWLSSSACPRPSGAGGASGASGASADGSLSCTDAVKPSTGPTVVRVGGSACVVVSGGGAVRVSNGTHTLNLTLSTGRDWLVLSASDFPDSDAGALLFMDLSSGGWLALDPSDGGELTHYAPASAADLPALLDAIVNSASTE